MCNFEVQSLIHFFLQERKEIKHFVEVHCWQWRAVFFVFFTECLKHVKEKEYTIHLERYYMHIHTHSHTRPIIHEVHTKEQAGTSRDHQVCVSILQCVFVPVMWSVVLRPIDAARVPALLPFFSKWPPF